MQRGNQNLLFPEALKRIRISRQLLQKSAAIVLGLDASILCGIEKGTRPPLDDSLLDKTARAFSLSDVEIAQLKWAARHDRLIGRLGERGATASEIGLLSASLVAWHHLGVDQRDGLLVKLQQIGQSARVLSSLANTQSLAEVSMP